MIPITRRPHRRPGDVQPAWAPSPAKASPTSFAKSSASALTFVMMILLVIVNLRQRRRRVLRDRRQLCSSSTSPSTSASPSAPPSSGSLVVKGDYKSVEKVFLIASVFYIAYIVAGVLSGPNWHLALVETDQAPRPLRLARQRLRLHDHRQSSAPPLHPWMQFYLQSSIVEKGITVRQYAASRLDVIVGSIFTDVVAWFIVVACAATLFVHGIRDIGVPSDAAEAMKPLAGRLRLHPLRRRALQRVPLRRLDPPPVHRLHSLRRPRLRKSGLDKSPSSDAPFFYWFYSASSSSSEPPSSSPPTSPSSPSPSSPRCSTESSSPSS